MRNMQNAAVSYPRKAVKKFLENQFPDVKWNPIIRKLPLIVWRKDWDKFKKYGLPYKRSYIQNLDSNGKGPMSYC